MVERIGVLPALKTKSEFGWIMTTISLGIIFIPLTSASMAELKPWEIPQGTGMFNLTRQLGGSLSGGEQQMLAIARGLVMAPDFIMMDEPSLGLAPQIVDEIMEAIRDLNQKEGLTVLLVEQAAAYALALAHRAYVFKNGEVFLSGPAAQLREDERVVRGYLGG